MNFKELEEETQRLSQAFQMVAKTEPLKENPIEEEEQESRKRKKKIYHLSYTPIDLLKASRHIYATAQIVQDEHLSYFVHKAYETNNNGKPVFRTYDWMSIKTKLSVSKYFKAHLPKLTQDQFILLYQMTVNFLSDKKNAKEQNRDRKISNVRHPLDARTYNKDIPFLTQEQLDVFANYWWHKKGCPFGGREWKVRYRNCRVVSARFGSDFTKDNGNHVIIGVRFCTNSAEKTKAILSLPWDLRSELRNLTPEDPCYQDVKKYF